MAKLLLGNVEEGVPDEEIREFLQRYGFPPFDSIERLPAGSGSPLALLGFGDLTPEALDLLRSRIHNMFWREKRISAQMLPQRRD